MQNPMLKITISLVENDDVLETLYTDEDCAAVTNALQENVAVYDTKEELDQANAEGADRG